jgi:prevent-host-death family protein
MEISVTDAKAQLTELVRRAEAGDEIVLTRHGHPAVRLVPVRARLNEARGRTPPIARTFCTTPTACRDKSTSRFAQTFGFP